MIARKPRSRSNALAPRRAMGLAFSGASGFRPRLTSALSAAMPAMIQIRFVAAMTSIITPQASAPATNAADPHSRSGPYLRPNCRTPRSA